MTISTEIRRAGPFVGNDSASSFSFAFKVFAAADLQVVRLNVSSGVETVLQLGTDYTVTLGVNQNVSPGGSVLLTAGPLANGYTLVIVTAIANTQPTQLTNQGGFYPEVINDALDRATMQIQQLQEEIDRSAKLPVTSAEDSASLVEDLIRIADSADNLDTVAQNIADVNTVADDIADVNTVADSISNVNAVGGSISNVNSVATNETNINTVATNNSNVTTVAGSIASVNTAAGSISNINTVASDLNEPVSEIHVAATNITKISTVSDNISSVVTTADNISNVNTVAGDIADVSTVATNIAGVVSIADNMAEVLQADTNAATATTQAGVATAQATIATTQAGVSTTQAGIATTQAGIATTKASEASASATSASGSATTATTQAGIATTKAGEAAASAASVNAANIVHAPSTGLANEAGTAYALNVEQLLAKGFFKKTNQSIPAFTKTGNFTVSTNQMFYAEVGGLILTIGSGVVVSMPTATVGKDYTIWLKTDGTLQATDNFVTPPATNARKIGGFHYAPGGNATGQSGGNSTAQINEYSIYDNNYRPACADPRGMTCVAGTFWSDIYFLNNNADVNGTSSYDKPIADNSTPPVIPSALGGNGSTTYGSLTWFEAMSIAAVYGKSAFTQSEFMAATFGVTEETSRGSDPVNTGLDAPRTSRWGVMQATGNMFTWATDRGGPFAAASWNANTEGFGSEYNAPNALLLGASWGGFSVSGSRSSKWNDSASASNIVYSLRLRCDHMQLE